MHAVDLFGDFKKYTTIHDEWKSAEIISNKPGYGLILQMICLF